MRKIKNKVEIEFRKNLRKTKNKVINTQSDKNRAIVSVFIYNIIRKITKYFKFDRKYNPIKFSNIEYLKFENNIISKDPFKTELSLFKQFFRMVYVVKEESVFNMLKYIKNDKTLKTYDILLAMKMKEFKEIICPYLKDIKDKNMYHTILRYIEILACFDVLYDAFKNTSNDELLEFYEKDKLKILRSVVTKIHNKIAHSFKWLTGIDDFNENVMKDKLKDIV